jgi:acyl-CoA thioester hydrolase
MAYVHTFKVLIREAHLDTFGHVNNATYLQLFEEARWELITSRGFGLDKIRETQTGPVILEARVKFQRELGNRETITIESELLTYTGKIAEMRQTVKREDGSVACDAVFVFGLMDLEKRRLMSPSPEWAHAVALDDRTERG